MAEILTRIYCYRQTFFLIFFIYSSFSSISLSTYVGIEQGSDFFFGKDGFPKDQFPNGWKGKSGLYAVGFTRRGLSGASLDAVRTAEDIGKIWKEETRQAKHTNIPRHKRCISHI